MRSATFTLLLLCGLSIGTGACGTILGAEDEYVVGAPVDGTSGAGGGALGGASGGPPNGGAGGAGAGQGASGGQGAGAATSGGTAGASGSGGATSGAGGVGTGGGAAQAGQSGQAGANAGGQAGGAAGFGGATVAGSGGAAGTTVGGTSGGGAAGASAGAGAGGGNGGAETGGSGGTSGGAAGAVSAGSGGAMTGGVGGSSSGTGGTGGKGGAPGGTGGTGGAGGAAGAGGGPPDTCCLAEVAAFTQQLVTQYEKAIIFTGFSYDPPNPSACYEYLTPVESTNSLIRFAAKSNVKGCSSLAIEVAAVVGKGARNAVGAACVTSNTTATTVTAAVNYCTPASKIVCHTSIVQGEAITSAACTDATCASCLTAGTASVKAWIKAQEDYYNTNVKFDLAMAPPNDTACYDYTFVYKDAGKVKLAAAAKSAACTSIAARAEGGPGLPGLAPRFSGVCTSPTNASFASFVTDTWGVIGDCERKAQGASTIACEAGATPVAGTNAIERSACGPE